MTRWDDKQKEQKEQKIRLNKFLSEAGVCSRREADALIEKRACIGRRTSC